MSHIVWNWWGSQGGWVHSTPSMSGEGNVGVQFPKIAQLPFWVSPSSWPKWRARALPIFLIWASAIGCRHPKFQRQEAQRLRPAFCSPPLLPGVSDSGQGVPGLNGLPIDSRSLERVDHSEVEGCIEAPSPMGRQSAPKRRNLPSLMGPNPALAVVRKKASRWALWWDILSDPTPQQGGHTQPLQPQHAPANWGLHHYLQCPISAKLRLSKKSDKQQAAYLCEKEDNKPLIGPYCTIAGPTLVDKGKVHITVPTTI